jgi:hypothetical protein
LFIVQLLAKRPESSAAKRQFADTKGHPLGNFSWYLVPIANSTPMLYHGVGRAAHPALRSVLPARGVTARRQIDGRACCRPGLGRQSEPATPRLGVSAAVARSQSGRGAAAAASEQTAGCARPLDRPGGRATAEEEVNRIGLARGPAAGEPRLGTGGTPRQEVSQSQKNSSSSVKSRSNAPAKQSLEAASSSGKEEEPRFREYAAAL